MYKRNMTFRNSTYMPFAEDSLSFWSYPTRSQGTLTSVLKLFIGINLYFPTNIASNLKKVGIFSCVRGI